MILKKNDGGAAFDGKRFFFTNKRQSLGKCKMCLLCTDTVLMAWLKSLEIFLEFENGHVFVTRLGFRVYIKNHKGTV